MKVNYWNIPGRLVAKWIILVKNKKYSKLKKGGTTMLIREATLADAEGIAKVHVDC